jgi:tetratricopeptide (TPR) repeat protein
MRTATLLLLLAVPALAGGADDAKALLARGEAAKAADTARRATASNPADIPAWLVLADALMAAGEPEAAWEAMDEAVKKNPADARLSIKRGDVFVRLAEQEKLGGNVGSTIVNYYLDAERNYKEAFGKDPKSAEAVYGMASVNFELGDEERKGKAKTLLADCLGLDKDFYKAHALQAYMLYLDGMAFARDRKHAEAKPKFQAAENEYAIALKLGDKELLDLVRYGHTLLAQERLDEAKAAYVAALKAWPQSEVPVVSGLYHIANRGAQKASWSNPKLKPLLEATVKEAPQSPVAWYYFAYCQTLESDWEDALKSYGKARDLDPKKAVYVFQVGHMHERLGDGDKALDCYRDALKLSPDYADVAFRFEGIIRTKQDMDRAEKLYEELIELAPENVDVHNNYALLLRDWAESTRRATDKDPPAEVKRRIRRSGEIYEKAAALSPDAQIQSDTGLLFEYYPCNFDADKAKRYFTTSLQAADFAYRDAFDGLDRLCRKTGDWETLADYAERVVGSMERGNHAIAPTGGGPAEAQPNETPGLKARAAAAHRLAQEKLRKS